MAKLTFFERLFPIRISWKDWSVGYYCQLDFLDGYNRYENIKIFQEWFVLKCHVCHKFSTGCGDKWCSFCGICRKCNKELQKMYEKDSKFI